MGCSSDNTMLKSSLCFISRTLMLDLALMEPTVSRRAWAEQMNACYVLQGSTATGNGENLAEFPIR